MLAVVLILYAVVFGMLIATCYHPKWKSRHVLVKTIQSLGFIWIATIASYYSRDFGFYFSMLPGFVLCLCGDISLAFNDRKPSDRTFLIGVGSFLIGHILFLTAFYRIALLLLDRFDFPGTDGRGVLPAHQDEKDGCSEHAALCFDLLFLCLRSLRKGRADCYDKPVQPGDSAGGRVIFVPGV